MRQVLKQPSPPPYHGPSQSIIPYLLATRTFLIRTATNPENDQVNSVPTKTLRENPQPLSCSYYSMMFPKQTPARRKTTCTWGGVMPARITHASEYLRSQNARDLKTEAERDAKAEWQGKFGSADRDELEEEDEEDGEEAETEGD